MQVAYSTTFPRLSSLKDVPTHSITPATKLASFLTFVESQRKGSAKYMHLWQEATDIAAHQVARIGERGGAIRSTVEVTALDNYFAGPASSRAKPPEVIERIRKRVLQLTGATNLVPFVLWALLRHDLQPGWEADPSKVAVLMGPGCPPKAEKGLPVTRSQLA